MACADCQKKAEAARQAGEPHKIVAWRAWYADARTFCSCDIAWEALPDDGALGFCLFFAGLAPGGSNLRRLMSGDDWYWKAGEIYAHSSNTTKEEIQRRYPGASVKRGMWTTDAEMQRIGADIAGARL